MPRDFTEGLAEEADRREQQARQGDAPEQLPSCHSVTPPQIYCPQVYKNAQSRDRLFSIAGSEYWSICNADRFSTPPREFWDFPPFLKLFRKPLRRTAGP